MNGKEFKKWWEQEKFKYPYRPPNEIDCGMGWNAALKWVLKQPDGSCGVRKCIPMEAIRDELPNNQTDNSTD